MVSTLSFAKEIGSARKIHMLAFICAVLVMSIPKLITAGAEHNMFMVGIHQMREICIGRFLHSE